MDTARTSERGATAERRFGLLLPIIGLMVALMVAVVAVAWLAADAQDRQAVTAMRHTLRSVVDGNHRELGGWASDYAYWDAFVENVVETADQTWIDDNIGRYAHANLDVDVTLVVDGEDAAYVTSLADGLDLGQGFDPMPEDLRLLARAARGSAGPPDMRPASQQAYVAAAGRLFMAAAAVAKWEGAEELPQRNGGPAVLIYMREVDEDMLAAFGADYMIRGLRLIESTDDRFDALPLTAPDGRVTAQLIWTSARPGTQFLEDLAIPLILILIVAGVVMMFIVVRVRSAVGQLLSAHNALNDQAEALRAARDEADRANRAKTEFLAQMSHDLRTPLNAILGFSEVIALQTFGSDAAAADRYRDYARQIHAGGDHLRTLVDSILDVAKLDAGRYELHTEAVSLDALVGTCLSLLGERLQAKALTVTAPPMGLTVDADRGAIEQVLLNLIGNAVKYTEEGGTISIHGERTADGVAVSIADTGRGMSPEDVEQAFELFTRGSEGLGTAAEGAGIGLSIVKRLVELHGGTVGIESALATGTTVTFTLPSDPTMERVGA